VYELIGTVLGECGHTMFELAANDGIMGTYHPDFSLNESQQFESAATAIYALIQMTYSFMRPKTGLWWEIVYPQAADLPVVTYYSSQSPYFYEYTERKNLKLPNFVYLFANFDPAMAIDTATLITAIAQDDLSIAAYDTIYTIEVAPEIDNQTDANNRAKAIMQRISIEELSGMLTIPHDCRLELYDKILIVDTRGV